jgi:hypothetical protein
VQAAEDVAGPGDPAGRPVAEAVEGGATGGVEARQAEDGERQAGGGPGGFSRGPAARLRRLRVERSAFEGPAAAQVAVDARRGKVSDPGRTRPTQPGRQRGKARAAVVAGWRGDQDRVGGLRVLRLGGFDAQTLQPRNILNPANRSEDAPAGQSARQGLGAVPEAEDEEAAAQSRALIASRAASEKSGRASA